MDDNQNDTQYVFDFALHESKIEGQNAIQLYKEKVGGQDEMEEIFLNALDNSYTSIFRVINTSPTKGLLFFKDMNITSGMGCSFKAIEEKNLMLNYDRHGKTNMNYSNSEDRFIFFYNAFKKVGMRMEHQEIQII